MPHKRKKSPFWWASFTDANGKRIRHSLGTTKRKEAEALEAKWKGEAFQRQAWGVEPDHTFEALMLDYLKAVKETKRSVERDIRCARQLRVMFGGQRLKDIGSRQIWAYQVKRQSDGVKSTTINRELAFLSTAVNFANRHWDWNLSNPVTGRKIGNASGSRDRWLTRNEANRLIQAAARESKAPYLADFIRLALFTGCRRGELLGLEWSRVDLHRNVIRLQAQHTKSGAPRVIPLCNEARAALIGRQRFRASHCPDAPFVFVNYEGVRIGSIKRSFSTACRRTGISDFRIHDLRHTFASWLVTEGVPLLEVSRLLGHSTVKMTERYAHLAPDSLESAVSLLDHRSHSGHTDKGQKRRGVVSH